MLQSQAKGKSRYLLCLICTILLSLTAFGNKAIASYPGDFMISAYGGVSLFDKFQAFLGEATDGTNGTIATNVTSATMPFIIENGVSLSFDMQYAISRYIRIGLMGNYSSNNGPTGLPVTSSDYIDLTTNMIVGSTPITAPTNNPLLQDMVFLYVGGGGYVDIENKSNFTPFGGGNIGIVALTYKSKDGSAKTSSIKTTIFYELVVGLDIALTPKSSLVLMGKQSRIEKNIEFSLIAYGANVNFVGKTIKRNQIFQLFFPKIKNNQVLIGLKFLL